MRHDGLDLRLGDEGPLDPHRLVGSHGQEQPVSLADELLRTRLIQDDATVGEARRGERQPARHVGLDQPGDDVDARTLRGEHQVDACRPCELRDADDRILDVARGNHHQVGELVDNDEQIRIGLDLALAAGQWRDLAILNSLVELIDMPVTEVRQIVVTTVHLLDDPLQCVGCLLRVRDDRRDQVRDPLVRRQLDPLGVDEDQSHLVGRGPHENRGDETVDAARLSGASGTGHEQVRHAREVGHHEAALDVLAERSRQRMVIARRGTAAQDIPQCDQFTVRVGDLDADGLLAGDRTEDANIGARNRVGDVLAQRGDALDLDAWPELDLVARDGRAAHETGDRGVDAELLHDLRQGGDHVVICLRRGLVRRTRLEHVALRQGVGRATRERELSRLRSRLRCAEHDGLVARRVTDRMHLGDLRLLDLVSEQVVGRVVTGADACHQDRCRTVLVLQHRGVGDVIVGLVQE